MSINISSSYSSSDESQLRLTVHLVVSSAESTPLHARFTYRRADPLVVSLDFPDSENDVKPWHLSRDLLCEGLLHPAGKGDVRVWPPCVCHGRPGVRILLHSRTACALLDIPVAPLKLWLEGTTLRMVPRGEEVQWIDWDILSSRYTGGSDQPK